MSFQSLAFFGFLAAALAVCLTAGRRPRAGAAMLAAASRGILPSGPRRMDGGAGGALPACWRASA